MAVAQNYFDHLRSGSVLSANPNSKRAGYSNMLFAPDGDPEQCYSDTFTIPKGKYALLSAYNMHVLECFCVERSNPILPCCSTIPGFSPYRIKCGCRPCMNCSTGPIQIDLPGTYRLKYTGQEMRGPSIVTWELVCAGSTEFAYHDGCCGDHAGDCTSC